MLCYSDRVGILETEHYSLEAEGLRITVFPEYIAEDSNPSEDTFAFSYTITIENRSGVDVQLLERHWMIFSGGTHIAEVVAPGIYGQQPMILREDIFEYTSTATIRDPIGRMEGSYTFRTSEGKFREIPIPSFDLHYPVVFH